MKTSIRLALTSFAVSCITLAAAGTSLPFSGAHSAIAATAAVPAAFDGALADLYSHRSPGPFALD